jgi:hypothetical protein
MAEPVTPGLAQLQHCLAAARQALAAGHGDLPWALLRAWPAWALEAHAPTRLRWRALGLRWHARALRHSIDGAAWLAAESLLPKTLFHTVMAAASDPQAPPGAALMPPPPRLAEQLQDCGRAIAVAALQPAALRNAVAAALGVQGLAIDETVAAEWVAWAEALPVDTGPAPAPALTAEQHDPLSA